MSHSPSHVESSNTDANVGSHFSASAAKTHSRFGDYLTLTKPRLNFLVLLTTAAAYSLGAAADATLGPFIHTLIGTFFVAGGSAALNQVWERGTDRLMRRTERRPMADQRLSVSQGTAFGLILTIIGAAELAYFVNPLSAAVALFTTASYIFFYTPLKLRTSLSTLAGAIPGALPAVIGWAAATNTLSVEAWVLFGIVFMWQMPHFLAIAWMYRDEYARAGMPLLPVIEPSGRSTGRQAVLYSTVLIPISMLPAGVGLATASYLVGAITLGAILLFMSVEFSVKRDLATARRLFFGSIVYLPILWALLVFDHRAR
ncbi:MAG TPA: heme o synthase [Vicinamibacterales bacterium]|nr:heme o synthase [Vicinamibacterales bacterium]